jgi:hypothetical protein
MRQTLTIPTIAPRKEVRMNLLAWITSSVKGAVLRGFEEAAEELELTHAPGDDAAPVNALQARMRAALPAPARSESDENRPTRKGKSPAA